MAPRALPLAVVLFLALSCLEEVQGGSTCEKWVENEGDRKLPNIEKMYCISDENQDGNGGRRHLNSWHRYEYTHYRCVDNPIDLRDEDYQTCEEQGSDERGCQFTWDQCFSLWRDGIADTSQGDGLPLSELQHARSRRTSDQEGLVAGHIPSEVDHTLAVFALNDVLNMASQPRIWIGLNRTDTNPDTPWIWASGHEQGKFTSASSHAGQNFPKSQYYSDTVPWANPVGPQKPILDPYQCVAMLPENVVNANPSGAWLVQACGKKECGCLFSSEIDPCRNIQCPEIPDPSGAGPTCSDDGAWTYTDEHEHYTDPADGMRKCRCKVQRCCTECASDSNPTGRLRPTECRAPTDAELQANENLVNEKQCLPILWGYNGGGPPTDPISVDV